MEFVIWVGGQSPNDVQHMGEGNQIRLGINAPKSVAMHREEISARVVQEALDKTS
jgi:carbon storage regulator CsrA